MTCEEHKSGAPKQIKPSPYNSGKAQKNAVYCRRLNSEHVVMQMKTALQELQSSVRALLPSAGSAPTGIPLLTACRAAVEEIRLPQTCGPYMYLVLDGTLRLHTPSGIMDYGPGQYSISQIDTPLSGRVLTFSEHGDFLALTLEFTPADIIASVLEIDNDLIEKITGERLTEQEMLLSDGALLRSVGRLLSIGSWTLFS